MTVADCGEKPDIIHYETRYTAQTSHIREVPGYDFPCQNPYGRYGFFPGMLHTIFRHENPCGLAFIRTMLRMEILRHRVQKDFSRTNLVRETSIFRGKF